MKYSKIIPVLFLFCCFILNTGCLKNNNENNPEILKLQQQAESGDTNAQYQLATKYLTGKDIKKDYYCQI